ncbi:MAG: phasin family protein [Thermodesulfobacteriota bacterium]|nr:phasin family protein [Thermodesulfobacteriota bacterium]
MFEEIRKGLLPSLGVILLTRQKAEEAIQKLVEEAKLTKEEAGDLVDKLSATGDRQWSEIEASITKAIRAGIDNLDIASKKELYALKSKVERLENRIETLEQQISAEKEG